MLSPTQLVILIVAVSRLTANALSCNGCINDEGCTTLAGNHQRKCVEKSTRRACPGEEACEADKSISCTCLRCSGCDSDDDCRKGKVCMKTGTDETCPGSLMCFINEEISCECQSRLEMFSVESGPTSIGPSLSSAPSSIPPSSAPSSGPTKKPKRRKPKAHKYPTTAPTAADVDTTEASSNSD